MKFCKLYTLFLIITQITNAANANELYNEHPCPDGKVWRTNQCVAEPNYVSFYSEPGTYSFLIYNRDVKNFRLETMSYANCSIVSVNEREIRIEFNFNSKEEGQAGYCRFTYQNNIGQQFIYDLEYQNRISLPEWPI